MLTRMWRRSLLCLLCACSAAVGPPDAPSICEGEGAQRRCAVDEPEVSTGPCPAGWSSQTRDSIERCAPWEREPACAASSVALPGERECVPVGDDCPLGEWPPDLPVQGVIFVRAGAVDGDGSAARPYGALATAIERASEGGTIALSRGVYELKDAAVDSLSIVGACEEEVEIVSRGPGAALVLNGRSSLARLRLLPEGAGVISRGEATLEQVRIEGAKAFALHVAQGELRANRLLLRNTEAVTEDTFGLLVEAEATIERSAILQIEDMGVAVRAGGRLTLRDSVVADGRPRSRDGKYGTGLVLDHGEAYLERAVFSRNREVSILAREGAMLTMVDTLVTDTASAPGGTTGYAMLISADAQAELRGVWLNGQEADGLSAIGDRARLSIERSVIEGAGGNGLSLYLGATANAQSLAILSAQNAGIRSDKGHLQASSLVVEGASGACAIAEGGAMSLRTAKLSGCALGLVATASATVELEEAVVRGEGSGVVATGGARASIQAARLERSSVLVFAGDRATVQLQDTAMFGPSQRCLNVQGDAEVEGARLHVERCDEVGVALLQGRAELESIRVRWARLGLGIWDRANVHRFTVEDSERCGVHLAERSQFDLQSGTVFRSAAGGCGPHRSHGLRMLENGTDWDAELSPQLQAIEPPRL